MADDSVDRTVCGRRGWDVLQHYRYHDRDLGLLRNVYPWFPDCSHQYMAGLEGAAESVHFAHPATAQGTDSYGLRGCGLADCTPGQRQCGPAAGPGIYFRHRIMEHCWHSNRVQNRVSPGLPVPRSADGRGVDRTADDIYRRYSRTDGASQRYTGLPGGNQSVAAYRQLVCR